MAEQQVASCTSNPQHCGGTGGCEGGIAELAFQSVIDNGGIASEWTYPYRSYQGTDFNCSYDSSKTPAEAKFGSFVKLKENNYADLINAVATVGPVSITVDAGGWHDYE